MEIIQRELRRGVAITEQIINGKAQWRDLFLKHTFFTGGYKYYLSIISASTTREAQKVWSGLVESKIRLLVIGLEGHESIALAHPFNKGFERVHKCHNDEEIERAKSGDLQYMVKDEPDISKKADAKPEAEKDAEAKENGNAENNEEAKENGNGDAEKDAESKKENGEAKDENGSQPTMVYTTTHYIGLEFYGGSQSYDLSYQVDDFKARCLSWDKYDDNLNALNIVHARKCADPFFSED